MARRKLFSKNGRVVCAILTLLLLFVIADHLYCARAIAKHRRMFREMPNTFVNGQPVPLVTKADVRRMFGKPTHEKEREWTYSWVLPSYPATTFFTSFLFWEELRLQTTAAVFVFDPNGTFLSIGDLQYSQ